MKYILSALLLLIFHISSNAQDSTLYTQGKLKYDAGKYKEALEFYSKAININHNKAQYYISRGNTYFMLEKNEEGFKDLCTAIKVEDKNYKCYLSRASFYVQIHEFDKAILDFTSAYNHAPTDSIKSLCLSLRGGSKHSIRNIEGAKEDSREALKLDSLNTGALSNLALALSDAGKDDEALPLLYKIIAIDSTQFFAYLNIGFKLSLMGKYKESLPYFDKSIQLSPDQAYAYNNRGYSKLMLNDLDGALSDINKSIKLDPVNSYAYKNRGLVYKAQGKLKKACEEWDTALKLGFTKYHGNEVNDLIKSNCL